MFGIAEPPLRIATASLAKPRPVEIGPERVTVELVRQELASCASSRVRSGSGSAAIMLQDAPGEDSLSVELDRIRVAGLGERLERARKRCRQSPVLTVCSGGFSIALRG